MLVRCVLKIIRGLEIMHGCNLPTVLMSALRIIFKRTRSFYPVGLPGGVYPPSPMVYNSQHCEKRLRRTLFCV